MTSAASPPALTVSAPLPFPVAAPCLLLPFHCLLPLPPATLGSTATTTASVCVWTCPSVRCGWTTAYPSTTTSSAAVAGSSNLVLVSSVLSDNGCPLSYEENDDTSLSGCGPAFIPGAACHRPESHRHRSSAQGVRQLLEAPAGRGRHQGTRHGI